MKSSGNAGRWDHEVAMRPSSPMAAVMAALQKAEPWKRRSSDGAFSRAERDKGLDATMVQPS